MTLFKEEKLYRIEIISKCEVLGLKESFFGAPYPSIDNIRKGNFGYIPVGTKGWVMKKWGKPYFLPNQNQEGLDLFVPADQPIVLIPYHKIKDRYKKL
ncbi:hypothetical protein [Rossellomorea sp. BNER]|uniref:hypothetical protein n=1 Tax=Rossellomorea sp. BNER TaxID=2962031 RepID=UPI003AF28B1B|nr:hypothetical protein [Rossellomorea sp. BNER]